MISHFCGDVRASLISHFYGDVRASLIYHFCGDDRASLISHFCGDDRAFLISHFYGDDRVADLLSFLCCLVFFPCLRPVSCVLNVACVSLIVQSWLPLRISLSLNAPFTVHTISCCTVHGAYIVQSPWYSWNIAESGVKHNKSSQINLYCPRVSGADLTVSLTLTSACSSPDIHLNC